MCACTKPGTLVVKEAHYLCIIIYGFNILNTIRSKMLFKRTHKTFFKILSFLRTYESCLTENSRWRIAFWLMHGSRPKRERLQISQSASGGGEDLYSPLEDLKNIYTSCFANNDSKTNHCSVQTA